MRRAPMNRNKRRMHNGLDLRAKYENVYSMLPGTVTDASFSQNGGNYVTVNHGTCICSYLHLSEIKVRKGQHVSAGQKMAVSGITGKRTTGPHLHISCRWSDTGKYFDLRILLRFVTEEFSETKVNNENQIIWESYLSFCSSGSSLPRGASEAEKGIGPPGMGSPIGKKRVMMVESSSGGKSFPVKKFHRHTLCTCILLFRKPL